MSSMSAKEYMQALAECRYIPEGTFVEGTPEELAEVRRAAESKDTNPKDAIAGTKPALWLVPPALRIIAEPAMRLGGQKYGPFNWREKGVKYNVYLDALERHMTAIREGQDIDPESGFTHLSHMAACVAIIADAMYIGKLIDDRPIAGGGVKLMEEISERYRK